MSVKDITQEDFSIIIDEHPLIIVDFWAKWCEPCISFERVFEEVALKYPEILFCKVNVSNNQELVQALDIKTIPTLLIAKQGAIIYKEGGTIPKKTLSELLDKASNLSTIE